ncbi:uncharacterized protein LOC129972523 isoform X1 [Argiope bruennichi]|uniref:uncharacterized protein LOC129972523 isoform X1 n=1 Tax=Argiope bruennichi TaxID=94029 RepID=UPI0024943736|nr:uncharacterized protein LOC129972523 isoform X1 [Argiope bruennichi]
MARHSVEEDDVKTAIRRVKYAYLPQRKWLPVMYCTNLLERIADCCAYLHLYAPLHTSMVYYVMNFAVSEMREWFRTFLSICEPLKICSLGGGPGTDIIGVVTALQREFGCFYTSAIILDIISDWNIIFGSVIDEITSGCYADIGKCLTWEFFQWSLITTNLLNEMDPDVDDTIKTADFVIMSKFISAISSRGASKMIQNIFKRMKPGAVLLYIDNDGGRHHKLVSKIAGECCLVPLIRPLQHLKYSNEALRIKRFGSWSCCETKITVQIMEKRSGFLSVWNYFPSPQVEKNYWDTYLQNFRFMSGRNRRHRGRHSDDFERLSRLRRKKIKHRRNRKLHFEDFRSLSAKIDI